MHLKVTELCSKWLDVSSKELSLAKSVEETEVGSHNNTLTQQVDMVFWNSLIDEEIE